MGQGAAAQTTDGVPDVAPLLSGWVLTQLVLFLGAALLWTRGWSSAGRRRQLLVNTRRLAPISALALLTPWHRRTFGPLVVVTVTTMAVLALDVVNGSRLQLSSLIGLQPVSGGRFYRMGPVTFAVLATATLVLCIALGNYL